MWWCKQGAKTRENTDPPYSIYHDGMDWHIHWGSSRSVQIWESIEGAPDKESGNFSVLWGGGKERDRMGKVLGTESEWEVSLRFLLLSIR